MIVTRQRKVLDVTQKTVGHENVPHLPTTSAATRFATAVRAIVSNLHVVVGVGSLLVVWWLVAIATPPGLFPNPPVVFSRIVQWFWSSRELSAYGLVSTGLGPNLAYTMRTVFVSQGIGLILGSVLGLMSARIDLFHAILTPIVLITTTIPVLVFAPFFLVWFGVGWLGSMLLVLVYALTLFIKRIHINF